MLFPLFVSGVPAINVTKKGLLGSKLTVSFSHPDCYPTDSSLRDELKYKVVQRSIRGTSNTMSCPSTSNSVEFEGGLTSSIKVNVYYPGNKQLGSVSSEIYKSKPIT
jgi:hypothetical protein